MMSVVQVAGGVALFIFGVRLLSRGMEKIAGRRIQVWLDRLTTNPVRGALVGMTATAMVQSSSMVTVTLLGLVNANLLTLRQAIGVILGNEIGTTFTAQIIAFDIGTYYLVAVVAGVILIEFFADRGGRAVGEILLGVGVLFMGMDLMESAMESLVEVPAVTAWVATIGRNPLAAVLTGAALTAVVQGSAAVVGLAVAMGMSGTITLPAAIGVMLGANIGTCIDTQLLAALRLSRKAFRASLAQVLVNVVPVLVFLLVMPQFARMVELTSDSLPRQIANAHTMFNLIVTVTLLPFVAVIARVVERLVPVRASEHKPKLTEYIDEMEIGVSDVAIAAAGREVVRMGEAAASMIDDARLALVEDHDDAAARVLEREDFVVDPLHHELDRFIVRLMEGDLGVPQQRRCLQLRNLMGDLERIADLAENMAQASQRKRQDAVSFSRSALEDLDIVFRHAHETVTLAVVALAEADPDKAERTCRMEEEFDHLYDAARERHIARLARGLCQPEADVIFNEVLRDLERVTDHADNIGVSVARTAGRAVRRAPHRQMVEAAARDGDGVPEVERT